MRRKNKSVYFIIILVVAFLGIGYAYLTTTLSINGVTDVDRNVWDVYFDNINVTTGSVTGTQVIDAPEIGNDDVSVSYHVNLKEPGEFYEFTIDAKNDGTIDAMIDSISKKVNGSTTIPAYLNFSVKYADGMEIINKHMLVHEDLETYRVRVEYRNDIDPDDLPSTAQSLTLSFTVNYVQADSNAVIKPDFVLYTGAQWNVPEVYVGNPLPDGIVTFTNEQDIINYCPSKYFLRHAIKNNIVFESAVGIARNGTVYYLKAGGATYNSANGYYNTDSKYYEANKEVLNTIFGSSNCTYNNYGAVNSYYCGIPNVIDWAEVFENGDVNAANADYGCTVSNGTGTCGVID